MPVDIFSGLLEYGPVFLTVLPILLCSAFWVPRFKFRSFHRVVGTTALLSLAAAIFLVVGLNDPDSNWIIALLNLSNPESSNVARIVILACLGIDAFCALLILVSYVANIRISKKTAELLYAQGCGGSILSAWEYINSVYGRYILGRQINLATMTQKQLVRFQKLTADVLVALGATNQAEELAEGISAKPIYKVLMNFNVTVARGQYKAALSLLSEIQSYRYSGGGKELDINLAIATAQMNYLSGNYDLASKSYARAFELLSKKSQEELLYYSYLFSVCLNNEWKRCGELEFEASGLEILDQMKNLLDLSDPFAAVAVSNLQFVYCGRIQDFSSIKPVLDRACKVLEKSNVGFFQRSDLMGQLAYIAASSGCDMSDYLAYFGNAISSLEELNPADRLRTYRQLKACCQVNVEFALAFGNEVDEYFLNVALCDVRDVLSTLPAEAVNRHIDLLFEANRIKNELRLSKPQDESLSKMSGIAELEQARNLACEQNLYIPWGRVNAALISEYLALGNFDHERRAQYDAMIVELFEETEGLLEELMADPIGVELRIKIITLAGQFGDYARALHISRSMNEYAAVLRDMPILAREYSASIISIRAHAFREALFKIAEEAGSLNLSPATSRWLVQFSSHVDLLENVMLAEFLGLGEGIAIRRALISRDGVLFGARIWLVSFDLRAEFDLHMEEGIGNFEGINNVIYSLGHHPLLQDFIADMIHSGGSQISIETIRVNTKSLDVAQRKIIDEIMSIIPLYLSIGAPTLDDVKQAISFFAS